MDTQKHREIWRPQGDSNPCYRRERANCNVDSVSFSSRVWTVCGRFAAIILLICALPVKADGFLTDTTALVKICQSAYQKPKGSLWQQEFAGYPTDWRMNPYCFRAGLENGYFSLSYGDAGVYSIKGKANDNEGCVVATRSTNCAGDVQWYKSTGSMRYIALTAHGCYGIICGEFGPAYVRQAFKEQKDDGFYLNEKLYGLGYFYGLEVNIGKKLTLGYERVKTPIGAQFGDEAYPAGTGFVNMVSVGYHF